MDKLAAHAAHNTAKGKWGVTDEGDSVRKEEEVPAEVLQDIQDRLTQLETAHKDGVLRFTHQLPAQVKDKSETTTLAVVRVALQIAEAHARAYMIPPYIRGKYRPIFTQQTPLPSEEWLKHVFFCVQAHTEVRFLLYRLDFSDFYNKQQRPDQPL